MNLTLLKEQLTSYANELYNDLTKSVSLPLISRKRLRDGRPSQSAGEESSSQRGILSDPGVDRFTDSKKKPTLAERQATHLFAEGSSAAAAGRSLLSSPENDTDDVGVVQKAAAALSTPPRSPAAQVPGHPAYGKPTGRSRALHSPPHLRPGDRSSLSSAALAPEGTSDAAASIGAGLLASSASSSLPAAVLPYGAGVSGDVDRTSGQAAAPLTSAAREGEPSTGGVVATLPLFVVPSLGPASAVMIANGSEPFAVGGAAVEAREAVSTGSLGPALAAGHSAPGLADIADVIVGGHGGSSTPSRGSSLTTPSNEAECFLLVAGAGPGKGVGGGVKGLLRAGKGVLTSATTSPLPNKPGYKSVLTGGMAESSEFQESIDVPFLGSRAAAEGGEPSTPPRMSQALGLAFSFGGAASPSLLSAAAAAKISRSKGLLASSYAGDSPVPGATGPPGVASGVVSVGTSPAVSGSRMTPFPAAAHPTRQDAAGGGHSVSAASSLASGGGGGGGGSSGHDSPRPSVEDGEGSPLPSVAAPGAAALASGSSHHAIEKTASIGCGGGGGGRTFTSKYRGVHQTFPTRRWEAQFRRNGKPTSLGCFDHEEEAARAYDRMTLWVELHVAPASKGVVTNFDPGSYEKDVPWLLGISQNELIDSLRSEGRRQAAHRLMRNKRVEPDEQQ